MDDVIFKGTTKRRPVGMAEVTLTFDNSDGQAPAAYAAYSEIEISRRLYRSGESEYLMNKAPARLKDVHDFFRDTGIGLRGYTIVEQGKQAVDIDALCEGVVHPLLADQRLVPGRVQPAVGDPPITTWEYTDFLVYFEYDRVIHSVSKRQ